MACECLLMTNLLQVVNTFVTSCNKSANDKLQQTFVDFNTLDESL